MSKLDIINKLIETSIAQGATEADAIMVDSSSLTTEVRMGKPTNIEYSQDMSVALRVLINQQQAIVSTSDFDKHSLDSIVERAIAMAKVTPTNPHLFIATKEQICSEIKELNIYDATETSAETLLDTAKEIEDAALENKDITNSDGASASASKNKLYFATSNGFCHSYQTSMNSSVVSVIAGKDKNMQTGHDFSIARFAEDLRKPKEIGKKAAEKTVAKLFPQKIASAELPVIFENHIAAGLLGAFAGAINGSSISRGTSFLCDSLGKEIFNPKINIIDDPFIIKGLASRAFDAEAISGEKLNIIEDGILKHYLLDLQTAHKLNMQTNARATRSLSSTPSPSISNMYISPGKESLKNMISSIKKGLFITDGFGSGANIITGEYSQGVSGFLIENGKITSPVSEITIAGNLKTMFMKMIPATDLTFDSSINSPSLFIEKMTIAGV
jgi:PmbA protein